MVCPEACELWGIFMKLLVSGAVLGGLLSLLAACATLNEDECKTVNWQQLGDIDGAAGHPATRIAKHHKACEKHKLTVDPVAYERGWQGGIARFCTPQNGFSLGRRGGNYNNSCPSEFAGAFVSAYRPARALHDAESDLQSAESEFDRALRDVSLLSHPRTKEDLQRLRYASDRLTQLRFELPTLRDNVVFARRNVEDYLDANPSVRGF